MSAALIHNKKKFQLYFILLCFFCQTKAEDTINMCSSQVTKIENDELCLTKHCAIAAAKLIEAMDVSVDPCQDFYTFACGGFMRKNLLEDHQKRLRTFDLFKRAFDLQLKDVMETLNPHGQPEIVKKIQEIYHVCINTEEFPNKELYAMKTFVTEILQWPLAEGNQWKPRFDNTSDFLINLETLGYPNYFFKISLERFEKTKYYSVTIEPQFLVSMSPERQPRVVTLLRRIAEAFGNYDTKSIQKDIDEMTEAIEFIHKYLSAWRKENPRRSYSALDGVSLSQLTELTKIDWLTLLTEKTKSWDQPFVESHSRTNFMKSNEWDMILELMEKFSPRVLYNLIGWNTIFLHLKQIKGSSLDDLYDDYAYENKKWMPAPTKRWKQCIDELLENYRMPVVRMFIERYIDINDKEKATRMVQTIIKATKKILTQSKFLNEGTSPKYQIRGKRFDNMKLYISHPDYLFNNTALDLEFSYVPEIPDTYFLYKLHLERALLQMKYFDQPEISNEKWTMNPIRINAMYDGSIWVPAGILQEPQFESNRLAALNFGSIGALIGHEIGHALRDIHSEKHLQNQFCLIRQYNKFCPEELQGHSEQTYCVNGKETYTENIADQSGLLFSFAAYKKWAKKHGQEKRLAGLQEYSPEQLFFLSFAHQWCEIIPTENWWDQYNEDEHAPQKYRVLGTLSNSKEFREAFSCPEGPMNRGNKSCILYEISENF